MARMPNVYPQGGPLYWIDDVTGALPCAVRVFQGKPEQRASISDENLELVRDYVEYWLAAPCWRILDDLVADYNELRSRIKTANTLKSLDSCVSDVWEKLGIDPF